MCPLIYSIMQIFFFFIEKSRPFLYHERLTTGKNEEYSWHVPAMKFIGMKQLV